jgi:hypothetical protein
LLHKNKSEKSFLRTLLLLSLILIIPIFIRKHPIKDWVIVYLFNAATNGILDKILTSYKIVKYPVRFLPKIFDIHILFDFLLYPLFTVFYNQLTYRDNVWSIVYKLLLSTFPMFLIELWAEKRTKLITWNKGWSWYHTYSSIIAKSLFTRSFIGLVRMIDNKMEK